MLYYIPTDFIYAILLLDVIILILLVYVSRINKKARRFGYFLIILLLIPVAGFKMVSYFSPMPSYEGTLKVTNNIKTISPVYYLNTKGDVIWAFLTFNHIQAEQDFDIEGRFIGVLAMNIDGKYTSKEFEFKGTLAKIEFNGNELNFERNAIISEMIERNILLINANYLSHLFTIITILFFFYIIIKLRFKTQS